MAAPSNAPVTPRIPYYWCAATLLAALSLPISLAVFNPTLMFERGWEQYAGSGLFLVALALLTVHLRHFWLEEQGLKRADQRLKTLFAAAQREKTAAGTLTGPALTLAARPTTDDPGSSLAERRLHQLHTAARSSGIDGFQHVMELNREQSALDQEHEAGRFTLIRYILYLLPVIGFIGTVEGISKALANISKVLPMVKDLDGFMNNLTSVTSALQIAFDSTLLALFLSATLMFVQTTMLRRAEDLLSRIDRWIVDAALMPLSAVAKAGGPVDADTEGEEQRWDALLESIDEIARALGVGLGPQTERLQQAVDRLASGLAGLDSATQRLADAGSTGQQFAKLAEASMRSGMALERIETSLETLTQRSRTDSALESVRHSVERTTTAVESLNAQFQQSFERSSRQSQENLTRTLSSLKDAIELINVSIEQGNTLYRGIVRTMFDQRNDDPLRKVG
jgi:biopolymer transport protein ExbB/TolQ